MDLGPQPRWPGVDEGLHRGVPPLGVPHKRHRHGAPNVICSLAKRKVYKSQKALQNVSPPHFEGVEREADWASGTSLPSASRKSPDVMATAA